VTFWLLEHENPAHDGIRKMVVVEADEDAARMAAARRAGNGELEVGAVWLAKPLTRCSAIDPEAPGVVLAEWAE
jgi:hypothetical protein